MRHFPITIILMCLALVASALGAEKSKIKTSPMAEITAEQRADMAASHEKMAACLRSDKSMEDCHKEMMKTCQSTMGKDACPMMGKMHGRMGKGMRHDYGKMEAEEAEEKK